MTPSGKTQTPAGRTSLTSPLLAAMRDEARPLELAALRAAQGSSLFFAGISVVAASLSGRAALLWILVGGLMVGWLGIARFAIARGIGIALFRLTNAGLMIIIPPLLVLAFSLINGPEVGFSSWIPAQLYIVHLVFAILSRLRWVPMAMALLSPPLYLVSFFTVCALPASAPLLGGTLFQFSTHAARAVVMFFAGIAAVVLTGTLQDVLRRAESSARARDLFGKYRLGERIAAGGMGHVVHATYCPEGGFARRVAVKRIHAHLADEPAFVQAFRDEASLAARLAHPNIVAVLDFGRVERQYFYAMEYVDGPTLSEVLRCHRRAKRHLDEGTVVELGRQILAALQHAHVEALDDEGESLRVVHRDISPGNVIVSSAGIAKLTDFGIARALGATQQHLTGAVVGKASYMAPEQARGEPIDPRADLFSVGVILHEALCLRRLFHRDVPSATLRALLTEPIPSPAVLRPGISPAWAAFFERALARDPGRRFSSAGEMADALLAMKIPSSSGSLRTLALSVAALRELPPPEDDDTVPLLERGRNARDGIAVNA